MKIVSKCKWTGCGKCLRNHNKSGFCGYHHPSNKIAWKKYGINYHRALSILRDKHSEEFKEIFNKLKDKQDVGDEDE